MENKFQFYNTLTRKVETVIPHEDGKIGMYTCGPTVYHFAHIGNLRSYIMEDVLEKSLRYVGYDVKRVMNITDVGHLSSDADTGEDKMLKGAKREHKTVMEIAKYYTDAFFSDCKKFYDDYVKNRPIIYYIVGNMKTINRDTLAKYGKVVELKKDDIFRK
jgi:cysteinyl-tRNA synthetase